jgi:hypothetical protein
MSTMAKPNEQNLVILEHSFKVIRRIEKPSKNPLQPFKEALSGKTCGMLQLSFRNASPYFEARNCSSFLNVGPYDQKKRKGVAATR